MSHLTVHKGRLSCGLCSGGNNWKDLPKTTWLVGDRVALTHMSPQHSLQEWRPEQLPLFTCLSKGVWGRTDPGRQA